MKKLLIAIIVFSTISFANAQNITGRWQGLLNAGGTTIRLVFNINKNADNTYTTTFDSPDQHAFGIKCNSTSVVKDSLTGKP